MNWDEFFMRIAMLAAQKSKDKSTQVGAVLVKDRAVISVGYNGICRGVTDPSDTAYVIERENRPEKYFWYEHAERNTLYHAARGNGGALGCTMYTNGTPCCDCARGIIQSGVEEVVVHKYFEDHKGDKWLDQARRSRVMFDEAGVKLREIEPFLGVKILRNGNLVEV